MTSEQKEIAAIKVKPEDIEKKREYFKNLIKTIHVYASEKLGDTWVRIKNKTSADISYPKMSTAASLDVLYSDADLDSIIDILQFIQVADEKDLEALIVLYGGVFKLISDDIYSKYKIMKARMQI